MKNRRFFFFKSWKPSTGERRRSGVGAGDHLPLSQRVQQRRERVREKDLSFFPPIALNHRFCLFEK